MDRILEILENKALNFGSQGMPMSTDTADVPTETSTIQEGDLSTVETDVQEQEVPQDIPEAVEQQAPESTPSDDFDAQFAELEALLKGDDTVSQATEAQVPVDQESDQQPKVDINENNYQELFDKEVERRVALEGEARQATAEAKYRKAMFEKEGDKYYSHIDKQKELEAELRIAQSATMPEDIAPL